MSLDTIIGGIIGIAGSLSTLLVERIFKKRESDKELKELRQSLLGELEENLRILNNREKSPVMYLKGDTYNYLKSTAKIGKFSLKLGTKLEEVFSAVQDINRDINNYHNFISHHDMVIRREATQNIERFIKPKKLNLISQITNLKEIIEKTSLS